MSSSALTVDFLQAFLESYPAAASVFELDGTMVFVNEHGCDFIGKSKDELIGKRVQDFLADRALAESYIADVIVKGYLEGEVTVTQSNGEVIGLRLTGILVKNAEGKPMGIVGMARATNTPLVRAGQIAVAVRHILDQVPERKMLTVEEVANDLRVSKETVRRWARKGQLPCVKLPRGIRIPSQAMKDLMAANLQATR